jgi:hypothetical protein
MRGSKKLQFCASLLLEKIKKKQIKAQLGAYRRLTSLKIVSM